MPRSSYHVVKNAKGQWAVRVAGNVRVSSIHETQAAAIKVAKVSAKKKKSNLVIHKENGKIRDFRSYS